MVEFLSHVSCIHFPQFVLRIWKHQIYSLHFTKTKVNKGQQSKNASEQKVFFLSGSGRPSHFAAWIHSCILFVYLFLIYSEVKPEKNIVYNKISITKYNANLSQLTAIKLFNKNFWKHLLWKQQQKQQQQKWNYDLMEISITPISSM